MDMKAAQLHSWQLDVKQAWGVQRELARQVRRWDDFTGPRYIAGVDVSVKRESGVAIGVVVVLRYPELETVEVKAARGQLDFPYIPGLLSFREIPLLLEACAALETVPDLILVDGQGILHPRRLGLAAHLGLVLDRPTIGCAKSLLCGQVEALDEAVGSYREVIDDGEVIGAALRTRLRVKPVYVSIGHRVSLESAMDWVLKCCRGYRLPEPTRQAHLAANDFRKKAEVTYAIQGLVKKVEIK